MYLTVISGPSQGRTIELTGTTTVGRDPHCAIVLDDDERVSRQHASIEVRDDATIELTDLGSTNGVFVDGRRISGPAPLRTGDTFRIGRSTLALRTGAPVGPATVIGIDPLPTTGPTNTDPTGTGRTDGSSTPEPAVPQGPPPPPGATHDGAVAARASRRPPARVLATVATVAAVVAGVVIATIAVRGDDDLTPEALTEQSRPGVLQVQSEVDGQLIGTGTGWVYDRTDGLIVTNYHVVGVGTTFTVGVGPDRRTATLVGAAPCEDLAVLRVDRIDDLTELPLLASQDLLQNGQEVVALGYPGTASDTPALVTSTGSISATRQSFDAPALDLPRYPNIILTQTPINPGNSGGPLLDLQGRVVGVNSAGSNVTQNQNYAIGVDRLREVVPELAAGDSHGWNGFVFHFPSSPDEVEALGYDPILFGQAVFALDAVPQSPAANTGLFRQLGGAAIPIIGVDDVAMDGTLQTLCKAIGPRRRGDSSTFAVTDGVDVFDVAFDYA